MATFVPRGVCSQLIDFDIDGQGCLRDVVFTGGCDGNLKAIAKLVEGEDARKVASILKGNTCGRRPTSCADQLACAIEEAQG